MQDFIGLFIPPAHVPLGRQKLHNQLKFPAKPADIGIYLIQLQIRSNGILSAGLFRSVGKYRTHPNLCSGVRSQAKLQPSQVGNPSGGNRSTVAVTHVKTLLIHP